MDDEKSQHLMARRSLLLLIDLQARLMPVLSGGTEAINSALWLGGIAQALEIPVWLTEHCPDKLGKSAPMTRLLSERTRSFTKRSFSALEEPAFRHALEGSGCDQLVVCGAEAHVCVMQTVLSLCSAGYRVALVADGVASRRPREAALGVARCEAAGPVSSVLKWWRTSGWDVPIMRCSVRSITGISSLAPLSASPFRGWENEAQDDSLVTYQARAASASLRMKTSVSPSEAALEKR